jgi:hypothetical protein
MIVSMIQKLTRSTAHADTRGEEPPNGRGCQGIQFIGDPRNSRVEDAAPLEENEGSYTDQRYNEGLAQLPQFRT